MNEQQFIDYFAQIAQAHLAIADDPAQKLRNFVLIDEALDGLKSGIGRDRLILVVRNEEGQARNLGNANLTESHQCGFLVLKRCSPKAYGQIREAHGQSLQACRDILGKMAMDKEAGHPLMKFLDLGKAGFRKEGPYFDSFYGYEINFSITAKAGCKYKFNPAKWLQEPQS